MSAVSRIALELKQGSAVHCVFLTDGGARSEPTARNRESLTALTDLGVGPDHIHFLGSTIPIGDGALAHHLDVALEVLERVMQPVAIHNVYCLAWEGGHPDHDASHLIAAAFAQRRGVMDNCWEVALYRGAFGGRLFRVLSPREKNAWQERRLALSEGLRYALLVRHYRSQRPSWLGLFPDAFLKLVVLRQEHIRNVDIARFQSRPHRGRLFYELWFDFPYERFAGLAARFIKRHFPLR